MATKIVTKNSSTASAVPTASDLVQGELAVNVADKRLFTEDNGGSIVELGTNPSTIDINAGSIDGTTIGASSASTGAFTTLTASGLTVDTNTLYVDSTNNRVGIGTTSPSGAYAQPSLHIHASGNGAELHLTDGTTGATSSDGMSIFQYANDGYIHMRENGSLRTYINGSERMRIDSAGNMGIGTTSPDANLHISGTGNDAKIILEGVANPRGNFIACEGADDLVFAADEDNLGAGSAMKFRIDAAERMRIDSSGNLLVGTTDPNPLDNTSGNGVAIGTSGVEVAIANGEALYLNRMGSDGRIVNFRKAGTFVSGIDVTATTVTYNTSSDYRLKENIADADDAGSKIDAIQVRKYDWKADGSHQDYGMIAQELQTVAPEAVSGDADSEEMMGVDYSKLVPMLIKEIQSLRNRVAQLEE